MTSWVREPGTDGRAGGFPWVSSQLQDLSHQEGFGIGGMGMITHQHLAPVGRNLDCLVHCRIPPVQQSPVSWVMVGVHDIFVEYVNVSFSSSHQTELSRTFGQASIGKLQLQGSWGDMIRIYSFNKNLLRTHFLPAPVLGTTDAEYTQAGSRAAHVLPGAGRGT